MRSAWQAEAGRGELWQAACHPITILPCQQPLPVNVSLRAAIAISYVSAIVRQQQSTNCSSKDYDWAQQVSLKNTSTSTNAIAMAMGNTSTNTRIHALCTYILHTFATSNNHLSHTLAQFIHSFIRSVIHSAPCRVPCSVLRTQFPLPCQVDKLNMLRGSHSTHFDCPTNWLPDWLPDWLPGWLLSAWHICASFLLLPVYFSQFSEQQRFLFPFLSFNLNSYYLCFTCAYTK